MGSWKIWTAAALTAFALSPDDLAARAAPEAGARYAAESLRADPDGVGVGAHELTEQSVRRLRDLGVRHVRTTLYWGLWVDDAAYRGRFVRGIERALEAGIEPLVVVHQQPSGGYADRERVYRAFASFLAARADQLRGVRYWQLWNEMDVAFTDVFGAGREDVRLRERGRNYAHMLDLAYPAIKRANPNAVVVTGGIASELGGGFLQGMYDGNAQYDVLAVHSYGFPVAPSLRDRGRDARRIMAAHGDSRPLWNTEFGMEAAVVPRDWPSTPADIDGYHLDAWRESVRVNDQEGIYQRVYGHVLEQGGDLSFDLIRTDGSPRPAYRWLKEYLSGGS